jgi:N-acetylmuramoyl-L-alanine amidase
MKIYLSPSVQDHNLYVTGQTEEQVMNKVCDVVQRELTGYFTIYRNNPAMDLAAIIKDSNKKVGKGGLHLAIHSNAGGGRGCVAFAYAPNTQSDFFAHCVYNQVAALTPTTDRGIQYRPSLAEVGQTKATACLVEVAFHDSKEDAKFILENIEKIGIAIANGIKAYCKIPLEKYTVTVDGLGAKDKDKVIKLLKGYNIKVTQS